MVSAGGDIYGPSCSLTICRSQISKVWDPRSSEICGKVMNLVMSSLRQRGLSAGLWGAGSAKPGCEYKQVFRARLCKLLQSVKRGTQSHQDAIRAPTSAGERSKTVVQADYVCHFTGHISSFSNLLYVCLIFNSLLKTQGEFKIREFSVW